MIEAALRKAFRYGGLSKQTDPIAQTVENGRGKFLEKMSGYVYSETYNCEAKFSSVKL